MLILMNLKINQWIKIMNTEKQIVADIYIKKDEDTILQSFIGIPVEIAKEIYSTGKTCQMGKLPWSLETPNGDSITFGSDILSQCYISLNVRESELIRNFKNDTNVKYIYFNESRPKDLNEY